MLRRDVLDDLIIVCILSRMNNVSQSLFFDSLRVSSPQQEVKLQYIEYGI